MILSTPDNYRKHIQTEVITWLRKYINQYQQHRGAVQRVYVRHLDSENKITTDVCSEILPPYTSEKDVPSAEDIERCAGGLLDDTIADARNRGHMPQKYLFAIEFEREAERPSTRTWTFRGGSRAEGDDFGHAEDSEPANAKGLVAQTMRHNEVLMKEMSFQVVNVNRILSEQNEALARQNNELMRRHVDVIGAYEKMMDGKKARELEEKRAEAWIKNVDSFADMLRILAPHAVNRISGKNIMPAQHTPEELELVALIGSLRPEQLDHLRKGLTPDQTLALLSVIERVQRKHSSETSLVPAGQSSDGTPGNGAPGGGGPPS